MLHTLEEYLFNQKWGDYGHKNGEFDFPWDVATGHKGQVFVADANNDRIQRFGKDGSFQLTFGEPKGPSFGPVDGELLTPVGIFVDLDKEEVYVTDDYRRVLVFDTNGNFLRNWRDMSLGGRGIAMDPNDYDSVFVVNITHSSIEVYDHKGNKKFRWGQRGKGNKEFDQPNSLAFDTQGYLYVADTNNHRIMKFTNYGNYIDQWGKYGKGDNQFIYPLGITVDPKDNVYVTDQAGKVRKFDNGGNFITSFGSLGMADGEFNVPSGIDTPNGVTI